MAMNSSSVSPLMREALNEQIREELASAYLYLALSALMASQGLNGFAHWLRKQWEEELVHALKLYDFLLQRDIEVELKPLDKPVFSVNAPLEVFELVLRHEEHITACINRLYAAAIGQHDYASQALLQWFVTEQLEEEESAREVIDALRLVGSSGASLFLLDREMGSREAGEEADA